MTVTVKNITVDPARHAARRHLFFFSLVILITAIATWTLADILWRSGMSVLEWLQLALFVPLFGMVAFGFTQAVVGFFILLRGRDPREITVTLDEPAPSGDDDLADPATGPALLPATAILVPICNEEVPRVYEGIRAMYQALSRTGQIAHFDFFILSDSSDPDKWIQEEVGWIDLCKQLGAFGRIFYRKRFVSLNQKSGNISDFCRRWGRRYRYMLELDADSLMTAGTIVRMVRLMEANPSCGILQTVPAPIESHTPFARMQQFSAYCYGSVFSAGLNFWQADNGNFWGHNAIIRVQPFMDECALPTLPGTGFARFMSHDYVEAALMRRAGYQVWLAYTLPGSFEELPPTIEDGARRDRRWCRGNFQHAWLLFARGFHAMSRLHITLGILSYLCSPLWLIFLLVGAVQFSRAVGRAVPSSFANTGLSAYLGVGAGTLALVLFLVTMTMLTLPKLLALFLVLRDPARRALFGGGVHACLSCLVEHTMSALLAPIQMLSTSLSVVCVLIRRTIGWGSQRRDVTGIDWPRILRAHTGHTVIGLLGALAAWNVHPAFFYWMLPITLGLVFSIPISAVLSYPEFGAFLNRIGLFRTPPESRPPALLTGMENRLASLRAPLPPPEWLQRHYGVAQVVLDPYVNAAHVSLLRVKRRLAHKSNDYLVELGRRLLTQGPAALSRRELMALLRNPDMVTRLHDRLWRMPDAKLPPWWAGAMRHYNLLTVLPSPLYR